MVGNKRARAAYSSTLNRVHFGVALDMCMVQHLYERDIRRITVHL